MTAVFNIPNTYLNDTDIKTEWLFGQTNKTIASDSKTIQKNIYENVYLNEIMNLNIIDNTNGLNKFNQDASNKFSNSIWNILDESNKRLFKVRYIKQDGTYTETNINSITYDSNENTLTFTYQLYQDGNVYSADIVSYDGTTTYASFVIPSTPKVYTITQNVHMEVQEKYGGI